MALKVSFAKGVQIEEMDLIGAWKICFSRFAGLSADWQSDPLPLLEEHSGFAGIENEAKFFSLDCVCAYVVKGGVNVTTADVLRFIDENPNLLTLSELPVKQGVKRRFAKLSKKGIDRAWNSLSAQRKDQVLTVWGELLPPRLRMSA